MNPLAIVIGLFVLHGVVGEGEMPGEKTACNCATKFLEEVPMVRNEVTSPLLAPIAETGFFRQTFKSTTCSSAGDPCMTSLYSEAHSYQGNCTPIHTEIQIRVYKSDKDSDDKMTDNFIKLDIGCACNAILK